MPEIDCWNGQRQNPLFYGRFTVNAKSYGAETISKEKFSDKTHGIALQSFP